MATLYIYKQFFLVIISCLHRVDATIVNKIGQSAGEIANFWGNKSVAETISAHLKPKLASQLEHVNYFSHSIVNRSSYKRSDQAFIDSEMR